MMPNSEYLRKERGVCWRFIIDTKPGEALWDLSRAVFKVLKDCEMWRSQVNKRQDTINKLRAENKRLRAKLK